MTALFDRYISDSMTEADRRDAGIIGLRHIKRAPAPPRPRKFWRRARFTLAVIVFALVEIAVTVLIVAGPVWSW